MQLWFWSLEEGPCHRYVTAPACLAMPPSRCFNFSSPAFHRQNPCHVHEVRRIAARVLIAHTEAYLPLSTEWKIASLSTSVLDHALKALTSRAKLPYDQGIGGTTCPIASKLPASGTTHAESTARWTPDRSRVSGLSCPPASEQGALFHLASACGPLSTN